MTNEEILTQAGQLLSDKKNWTQGAFARNEKGESLDYGISYGAVCFCAMGALEKVMQTDNVYGSIQGRQVKSLLELALGESVASANDSRSHYNIVLAFGKAAKLAQTVKDPVVELRQFYETQRQARLKPQE